MKSIEINQTELNALKTLFKAIEIVIDPTQVTTKSIRFIPKSDVQSLERTFLFIGSIGLWKKLLSE